MEIRFLPQALRRLRTRAAVPLDELAAYLYHQLQVAVPAATLEAWEEGRELPGVEALFAYLAGLALDLSDLQLALEEVAREASAGEPDPLEEFRKANSERLVVDPGFRRRVADLVAGMGLDEVYPELEPLAEAAEGSAEKPRRP